jgi:DNA-directed RNA polymerase sigma subunit (sigma70/sigma32)
MSEHFFSPSTIAFFHLHEENETDDLLLNETLDEQLGKLTQRQRQVVELHLGLNGNQQVPLSQCAEILELDRSTVTEHFNKAMCKIKGNTS